ncbi:MAG: enoyl-CoA hydratase-related protein [Micropepsaceae bacterium]
MHTSIEARGWKRIKVSRDKRILTLTLSNPGMRNAVDPVMHEELAEVFYEANRDAGSDVVVLTGEGADFCAGGDITWFRRALAGEIPKPSALEGKKIIASMLDLEKPLIAKVRGPAVGLGATIALFCDVIFAAENAVFIDPHVKVGIVAGDGGAVIWPHLIGHARAKEFLMTGDPVPAQEAWRMGLVNHVVPEGELDARVEAFVKKLAGGATQAIRYTKVSVNLGLKALVNTILDASIAYEMTTFETDDHKEAVAAFLEKRRPSFTGR